MKNLILHLVIGGFCVISSAATGVQAQLARHLKIEKYKLDNGLTVILHEDPKIPMVSYHQWFRVGSYHEKVGRTGLAHFFEHLMFKGTEKVPGDKYELLINGSGGSNNAFTSRDYTGYYTHIPKDKLESIVELEADRMVNLLFDPKAIDSERQVVKEERRMRYDNNPPGKLYEQLYLTVFQKSSYRWPVIGYMKDLNAASVDDFKNFYNTYYAPNNAVIVVAGDFSSSQVKSWIQKYYGKLEAKKIPEFKKVEEPKQTSPRSKVFKMGVQSERLVVAYKTVSSHNEEEYALNMLADVLGGGETSRLYRKLVRDKQWVTSVSAHNMSGDLEGVMAVFVDLKPGVSHKKVVNEISQEMAAMAKVEVSDDELLRSRNQTMLAYTQALKTANGKARLLAMSEVIHQDPKAFFKDLDHYAKVSKADIQQMALKYLSPSGQSVVRVVPK